MKKTKISFDEIKSGDMLYTVETVHGVKWELTGIAFEKFGLPGEQEWRTSQGGNLVNEDDDAKIYRIDVSEVRFQDIKAGDLIRVTYEPIHGDMVEIVKTGMAYNIHHRAWVTPAYEVLVSNDGRGKIEILERAGE